MHVESYEARPIHYGDAGVAFSPLSSRGSREQYIVKSAKELLPLFAPADPQVAVLIELPQFAGV